MSACFFGEDIFVAFGAIALMHTFLLGAGLDVEPLHIALWGIPTALCAFFIHALRLHRFDRQLYRELTREPGGAAMILSIQYLFWLAGAILALTAVMTPGRSSAPQALDHGLFWGLFSLVFLIGDRLPPAWVGAGVLLMAVLAGSGAVGSGHHASRPERETRASAGRLGNRLFIPALAIPVVTVIAASCSRMCRSPACRCSTRRTSPSSPSAWAPRWALALACWLTRDTPIQAMREIAAPDRCPGLVAGPCPRPWPCSAWSLRRRRRQGGGAPGHRLRGPRPAPGGGVGVGLCVGMAAFTVHHGQRLRRLPGDDRRHRRAGAGGRLPRRSGGDGRHRMFSGYCGTLMTPMAANFNIVPAALLELDDKNAVIKAQVPTALAVLACNVVLLYLLM